MTTVIRWLLAVAVLAGGALLPAPAAAAAPPILDGFVLRYLPDGLGISSDFAYEYDDVAFAARLWESGSDDTGWQVDLDVQVLRGVRLSDATALHDWFVGYEDRPPSEAHYVPVRVRGRPGWACHDEVFWLVRPGVAVAVRLDRTRWTRHDLLATARGVRPG